MFYTTSTAVMAGTYRPRRLYYTDMSPVLMVQYISGHLGQVMAMYTCYYSWWNLRMTLFNVSGPAVPFAEDNATIAN